MNVPRAAYYDKELELRLSRSYGPGRYDRAYEERGLDYPDRLRALDRAAQHGRRSCELVGSGQARTSTA